MIRRAAERRASDRHVALAALHIFQGLGLGLTALPIGHGAQISPPNAATTPRSAEGSAETRASRTAWEQDRHAPPVEDEHARLARRGVPAGGVGHVRRRGAARARRDPALARQRRRRPRRGRGRRRAFPAQRCNGRWEQRPLQDPQRARREAVRRAEQPGAQPQLGERRGRARQQRRGEQRARREAPRRRRGAHRAAAGKSAGRIEDQQVMTAHITGTRIYTHTRTGAGAGAGAGAGRGALMILY